VGWIKMSASRRRVGCAAIPEFMDMKSMIARSQASDVRMDAYSVGDLGKRNGAADLVARGGVKHRDSLRGSRRFFCRRLGLCAEACH